MDNDVVSDGKAAGDYLRAGLEGIKERHSFITDVRGMGLLLAMGFNDDNAPRAVAACNEEGLLLNPVRPNAIRMMPPLTISHEEIDQGLERLEMGLKKAI